MIYASSPEILEYSQCRSVVKKDCYCIPPKSTQKGQIGWYAIAVFFRNASTSRVEGVAVQTRRCQSIVCSSMCSLDPGALSNMCGRGGNSMRI